jgi:hypothetical protein
MCPLVSQGYWTPKPIPIKIGGIFQRRRALFFAQDRVQIKEKRSCSKRQEFFFEDINIVWKRGSIDFAKNAEYLHCKNP